MDQEERITKQNYLRDEIVSKGFDVRGFKQLLVDSKTDGENIDNWTMSELRSVKLLLQLVAQFQSLLQV